MTRWILGLGVAAALGQTACGREAVRMAASPDLSPDGKTLAFAWRGDIWTVPAAGGKAARLTAHAATDSAPKFSPDGQSIAFNSDRDGATQVYVMDAAGGTPARLTYHSEGSRVEGWYPGGASLLTYAGRDHFWRRSGRFFKIDAGERSTESLLFDAAGSGGSLSPDGKRLLFTREGTRWYRQGYTGSQASQIWLYDFESEKFTEVLKKETPCRSPVWAGDHSFYYAGVANGSVNLRRHDLKTGEDVALTDYDRDPVVSPCASADGRAVVFRRLFDFYRVEPGRGPAVKIDITCDDDVTPPPAERRALKSATDVAFTADGLQIAFIAGGDVWVMDTELREPKRVTDTPEPESDPLFAPDGKTLLYIGTVDGRQDIWAARRGNPNAYWWRNDSFELSRVTDDAAPEANLSFSPDGKKIAYVKGGGDLWVSGPDGKNAERVIESWNAPDYDWSPDGKWVTYAVSDNEFNRDVWVAPIDGSRDPVNISRHPDNESGPRWSPDGQVIAFTGRRVGDEVDIFYVYLREERNDAGSRDRKLEAALRKMKKSKKAKKKSPEVKIDFGRIHERLRRVSIPQATERGLLWSPDSGKLAFAARVEGRTGLYTVKFPDPGSPTRISGETGRSAVWVKSGQIRWLDDGQPATLSPTRPGQPYRSKSYSFTALQTVDRAAHNAAAFDVCWRTMRDRFYDPNLKGLDWGAIRAKYRPMAREAADAATLSTAINMMLGELNASHMGFRASRGRSGSSGGWRMQTGHLGVRFDPAHRGAGWKVRDVIADGPADRPQSRIKAGEVILEVEGVKIDPGTDVTRVLNLPPGGRVTLKVSAADGEVRDVTIDPISYRAARALLYEEWIRHNRRLVEEASGGKLGYLHVRAMSTGSFYRFERELYAAGYGKDGLIIDVRENGGGSTTDRLLTSLTQPVHAITVPRGGGRGYPQDRKVYASWHKPVAVLCNQNSFSNAEIFSHAIKTLGRGKVVGVPTAGGVISTGGMRVMDVGTLRTPVRGWYVLGTGEDMELNGAVPDYVVWPQPGEWPSGVDRQLTKAAEVLGEDVKAWKAKPGVKLRTAGSE